MCRVFNKQTEIDMIIENAQFFFLPCNKFWDDFDHRIPKPGRDGERFDLILILKTSVDLIFSS